MLPPAWPSPPVPSPFQVMMQRAVAILGWLSVGFLVGCGPAPQGEAPVPTAKPTPAPAATTTASGEFPALPDGAGPIADGAPKTFETTASGLKYRILRPGTGKKPAETDSVEVNYHGWLDDGTVFDSSYRRGAPISFPLSGVIRGWTEGMQYVGEGGMIELEIPYELGYGESGSPPTIPPRATLHFLVELKQVR